MLRAMTSCMRSSMRYAKSLNKAQLISSRLPTKSLLTKKKGQGLPISC
jgi:hypothetical protein